MTTPTPAEHHLAHLLQKAQSEVRVDNLAISIGELIGMYEREELVIRPEYQRLLKWDINRKTQLIESVLVGLPLPCIFVSMTDCGKWEVVDGLQRSSTLIDYVCGLKQADVEFIDQYQRFERLTGELTYLEPDDGDEARGASGFGSMAFVELPEKMQLQFKRTRVNITVLQQGTSENVKYELFQRLNNSGVNINPQELRNAILAFKRKDYQDALNRLARHEFFKLFKTQSGTRPKNDLNHQRLALCLIVFKHLAARGKKCACSDSPEHLMTLFVRQELCGKHADLYNAEEDERAVSKAFDLATEHFGEKEGLFVRNYLFSETLFLTLMTGFVAHADKPCDGRKLKELTASMETSPVFSATRIISGGMPLARKIPAILAFSPLYFEKAFDAAVKPGGIAFAPTDIPPPSELYAEPAAAASRRSSSRRAV